MLLLSNLFRRIGRCIPREVVVSLNFWPVIFCGRRELGLLECCTGSLAPLHDSRGCESSAAGQESGEKDLFDSHFEFGSNVSGVWQTATAFSYPLTVGNVLCWAITVHTDPKAIKTGNVEE